MESKSLEWILLKGRGLEDGQQEAFTSQERGIFGNY